MSIDTLATTPDIEDIIYGEDDDATCMLALMERPVVTRDDIRSAIEVDLYVGHPNRMGLSILALAKNKNLGADELWALWRAVVNNPTPHRRFQSARYLISHPSLTRSAAEDFISIVNYRQPHWSTLDLLAQIMTSPHVTKRQWKSMSRAIAENFSANQKDSAYPTLTGARNKLDPTALMGDEPSLSEEQVVHLYEQARSSRRDGREYLQRTLMQHPAMPLELRQKLVANHSDSMVALSGLCANPTVTERELVAMRSLFHVDEDFRRHAAVFLARNPKTSFLGDLRVWAQLEMQKKDEEHNRMWHLTILSSLLENPSTDDKLFNLILAGIPGRCLALMREEHDVDFFLMDRTTDLTRTSMLKNLAEASIMPPNAWIEKMGLGKETALSAFDSLNPLSQIEVLRKTEDSDLLVHASTNDEFDVRQAVARNEHTPLEVLERLAVDEDSEVRGAVAGNEKAPESMLLQLAQDSAFDVKRILAQHRSLPESVQRALASDKNWKVRNYLLSYGKPMDEIRAQLKKDPRITKGGF